MTEHFAQPLTTRPEKVSLARPGIPPHLLVSFVSVARHKSLAHAATVQCIPHQLMAQQMTRLEALVGEPLFDTAPGRFELSRTGERLFAELEQPIAAVQASGTRFTVDRQTAPNATNTPKLLISLRLWGLASLLQPYLSDLDGVGAELSFTGTQDPASPPPDVICYLGQSPLPGYDCDALFGEEIVTVCSPRYPKPKAGFEASQLFNEPLLSLAHPDHRRDWHGFLGIDPETALPGIKKAPYPSFSLFLKALRSGRGIGVGLAPLFAADIADGQLQLASQRRVWRNRTVYLAVSKTSQNPLQARHFVDVLRRAFQDGGQI